MGGACFLHDRGVQKLTLNMLCPFLTSPGEGRPQHNITFVLEEDNVGYTCYAVFLDAGTNLDISSAFGKNFNHIYYCISGNVCFECDEGTNVTLISDTLIALPGGIEAKMNTTTKTHLFITYVKESTEGAQPQKPLFCVLDEIIGTEIDIDWIRGRSRRFLRQSDGFNVSLHNTVAYEGTQK